MTTCFLRTFVPLGLLVILISGCGRLAELAQGNDQSPNQIAAPTTCTDTFIPLPLDFTTTVRSEPVRMFDSNGAGVAVDDLDNDGDLDVVVNNLLAPAMVYENQICAGAALEVDLRWPRSGNTHALGAILTLTTDDATLTRMVRAGSGYASGNPGRIHFGFPGGAQLEKLDIRWPDGAVSSVDALEPGALLAVTRQ